MATIDSTKTRNNLLSKGFQESNSDHKRLEFWYEGKFVLNTKISHGPSHDLNEHLIHQMSKQCLLTKQEFLNLANCPLKEKDYLQILNKKQALK